MKKTFKHRELDGIGECSLYDKEVVVAIDDVDHQPVYCNECGRELVEISNGDEEAPNPPRRRWWIWIVVAVVGIVLIFIFVRGCNPTNKYYINAKSNDDAMGAVKGGGSFEEGDSVTLSANAKDGYCFVNWSDSLGNNVSKDSVWKFCVECDALFIAHFTRKEDTVQQYTVSINSADNDMGYVAGGGTYPIGTTITIKAIANAGYVFSYWSDGNGRRISTNANCNVCVEKNMDYTAFFHKTTPPPPPPNPDPPVYGNYHGPRNSAGEPHGKGGQVSITTEYHWNMRVFSPGDVIENTIYENGQLKSGRVIKKNGDTFNI